uniref:Uncharacterized protein n=1 Tax=Physcomitrium patens TaxID=3218 RepID=A0A2K1LB23_PHYPA|nr:hypothetical protein PHYPA_001654 [Physcomitrium patens]
MRKFTHAADVISYVMQNKRTAAIHCTVEIQPDLCRTPKFFEMVISSWIVWTHALTVKKLNLRAI